MRGKLILLCGLCAVLILFTGCPSPVGRNPRVQILGRIEEHLPEWICTYTANGMYSGTYFWGFSGWKDWQADEYAGLRELIQNCGADRSGFTGKFRIIDLGQFLSIQFSDKKTPLRFFLWLGEYKETGFLSDFECDRVCSSFLLTGILKYLPLVQDEYGDNVPSQGPDGCSSDIYIYDNFEYEKKDVDMYREKEGSGDGIYHYTYRLKAAGRKLLLLEMKTYQREHIPVNRIPSWMPEYFRIDKEKKGTKYYFYREFTGGDESDFSFRSLCGDSKENALYYMGGVEQDGPVDNINKKVRYRLYDGTPDDPVYVEIKSVGDSAFEFRWLDGKLKELSRETLYDGGRLY